MNKNELSKFPISTLKTFENYSIKGSFLYTKPKNRDIKVGFIGNFDTINKFHIHDKNLNHKEDIINADNFINVYYEKISYINDLDVIKPDMESIYSLLDKYFLSMKRLRISKYDVPVKNEKEFFKYIENTNFFTYYNFPWVKNNGRFNKIDNNLSLFLNKKGKVMVGYSLRFPTRPFHVVKLYIVPKLDGSYKFYIRDSSFSNSRGVCIEFNNISEIESYVENSLFKSAYYYKPMKDLFGDFKIEDVNDKTFEVMEMFKV